MPIYTYRCTQCGKITEQFNTVPERKTNVPKCHGKMDIKITPPAFVHVDKMPEYRCPATGQMVTTRRQRNNIMAEHQLVDANDLGPP